MVTISLCMIVKNEESSLSRCLESVKDIVDNIIIVDTGSIDKTKEIAKEYTKDIYDFKWEDNFSKARNFSFYKSKSDYTLWLDADDVILDADKIKFLELKENFDVNIDSVSMHYNVAFDNYGVPTFSYRRNRLVKTCNNYKWIGAVHEYLDVSGNIFNSNINVTHKKTKNTFDRNLNIYKDLLNKKVPFTQRDYLYYGNELYENKYYCEALKYFLEFLSSKEGWIEDKVNVCGKISDFYYSSKNIDMAISYCFESFKYDAPRAEICCRLGYYFINQNKINQAIYWYSTASKLERPVSDWGFLNEACWTYIPYLQLCVCYDKLGDFKKAFEYNEKVLEISPNNEAGIYNREYFEKKGLTIL